MGDSPTVLRFLSGDQNDPTKESWGGEFIKVSDRYYTDNPDPSLDLGDRTNTKGAMTIYEDRDAWLNSFAERFDWLKDATAPIAPAPTGPDTITVRVCGSALNGDPNFALTLNGRVIDATNLVTADRADGEWEVFTYKGSFVTPGVTAYRLGVQFTNDAFQAGVGDRNIWVDEVSLNGVINGTDRALTSNGTATWDIQLAGPTAPASPTNLLVNGSFEATAVPAGQYAELSSVPGWTPLSGGRIELWNAHRGVTAAQGANFAELDHRSALDGFYQDVQTKAGQAYALSFDLCARPGVAVTTQGVEVLWNGKVVTTAAPGATWRTASVNVTGTGGQDRLTVREVGSQGGDGWGALLDNFRLVPTGTALSSVACEQCGLSSVA
jgi:hypothetical protein